MTDQESSGLRPQESTSTPAIEHGPKRFTLIAAVGLMGEEEDCRRFMELMIADFNNRCREANEKIMKGRIQLLPIEETLPSE